VHTGGQEKKISLKISQERTKRTTILIREISISTLTDNTHCNSYNFRPKHRVFVPSSKKYTQKDKFIKRRNLACKE